MGIIYCRNRILIFGFVPPEFHHVQKSDNLLPLNNKSYPLLLSLTPFIKLCSTYSIPFHSTYALPTQTIPSSSPTSYPSLLFHPPELHPPNPPLSYPPELHPPNPTHPTHTQPNQILILVPYT